MTSPIVQEIGKAQLRKLPRFHVGDTVRVHVRVVEGGRTRTQAFQGTVIGRRGSGPGEFDYPVGVAVAPNGWVYVTEEGNYRVQYFRWSDPAVLPTSLGRVKALFR